MWNFHWTENNSHALETLFCQNLSITPPHPPGSTQSLPIGNSILSIEIEKTAARKASILIRCQGVNLSNKMLSKLLAITSVSNDLSEINCENQNHITFIQFKLNYEESLKALLELIKVLYLEITPFSSFKPHLSRIFAVDKITLLDLYKEQELEQNQKFSDKFERHIENNMNPTLHASIRQCEMALRSVYGFPVPHYRSSVPPLSLADEDENENEETEEHSEEQDDDNSSAHFQRYNDNEAELVEDLLNRLEKIQLDLLEEGFVEVDNRSQWGVDMILTEYGALLISNPELTDDFEDIEKARLALNINTAIRAMSNSGSHSRNDGMEFTQISGYGLYNIVALLWHACKQAHAQRKMVSGVTLNDALQALAQGIADGARGNNRNFDVYDNLKNDLPSCDQGKYNSLFSALIGILPEIQIQYSYLEQFVIFLKNSLLTRLVQSCNSLTRAKLLLEIWNGSKTEDDCDESICLEYNLFKNAVTAAFPALISEFIKTNYEVPIALQNSISEQIKKDVKEVEDLAMGLSYIESISPTAENLDLLWSKAHSRTNSQPARRISKRCRLGKQ